MSAIAELNVRLGIEFKKFDADLRRVQRSMEDAANKLSGLGNAMSVGITLPLLAFGKQAVQASGEFESLRLAMESTMKGAGRSIGEAHRELEALRKASLAPGLDLEQAVQGSIRLQNVGLSAEKARGVLVQLANAVATTGGTAVQLDGVTKQFGQMLAKGRILQEDLGIIQENMPAISQAMEQAFGTKSAEKLRAMGISAEQFIDGVTKQLATLPRVQGGVQNALVNAGSALRQFMAGVGDEISRVFDISGKSNAFSDALSDATLYFKSFNDEQKKAILNYALLAAGAGPAIKGVSLLAGMLGSTASALRAAASGAQAAIGTVLGAADKFSALSAGMKFQVVFAAVGGVLALAAAYSALKESMENANPVYKSLKEIEEQATKTVQEERGAIAPLIATLESETSSREQKEKALKRLQEISPQHFKNLDIEAGKTGQLKLAVDAYVESLLKAARVKAAEKKLIELDEKQQKLAGEKAAMLERVAKIQQFAAAANTEQSAKIQDNVAREQAVYKKMEDEYERQKKAIQGVIETNTDLSESRKAELEQIERNKKALQSSRAASETAASAAKEAADKQRKALQEVTKSIQVAKEQGEVFGDTYERVAEALTKGIEKLTDEGFKASSKEVKDLVDQIGLLKRSLGPVPVVLPADRAIGNLKSLRNEADALLAGLEQGLVDGFGAGNEDAQRLLRVVKDLRTDLEAPITPNLSAVDAMAALDDLRGKMSDVADVASQAFGPGLVTGASEAAKAAAGEISALAAQMKADTGTFFPRDAGADAVSAALDDLRGKAQDLSDKLRTGIVDGIIVANAPAQALADKAQEIRERLENLPVDLSPEAAIAALDELGGEAYVVANDIETALEQGFSGGTETLDALIGKAKTLATTVQNSLGAASGLLPAIPRKTTLQVLPDTSGFDSLKVPDVGTVPTEVSDRLEKIKESAVSAREALKGVASTAQDAFSGLAESLSQTEGAYKNVGIAALMAAAKIVKAALAAALARSIQKSIETSPHPLVGILLAGAAMAGIEALFKKLESSMAKSPRFAAGTNSAPGGMALVGEFGPEMVSLPKGSQVVNAVESKSRLRDMFGGQTVNVEVTGVTRISGTDLYIMYRKGEAKNKRITG